MEYATDNLKSEVEKMKLLPEKVSYRAVIELVVVLGSSFIIVLMYFGSSKGVEKFKQKIIKDEKFMTEEGVLFLVYEAKVEKKTKTFRVVSPVQVVEIIKEKAVKGDEKIKVVERTIEKPVKGDEKIQVVERTIEKPVKGDEKIQVVERIVGQLPVTEIPKTNDPLFGLKPHDQPASTTEVQESLKRIGNIKKYTVEMINSKRDGKKQAKEILELRNKLVFVAETSNNLTQFKNGLPSELPKLLNFLIESYHGSLGTNEGLLEFVEGVTAGCGNLPKNNPRKR